MLKCKKGVVNFPIAPVTGALVILCGLSMFFGVLATSILNISSNSTDIANQSFGFAGILPFIVMAGVVLFLISILQDRSR